MYTQDYLNAAASRGARWMTRRFRGWHHKIDCNRLNLAEDCGCVLGQNFGSFERTIIKYLNDNSQAAAYLGFIPPTWGHLGGSSYSTGSCSHINTETEIRRVQHEFDGLRTAWLREIDKLRLEDVANGDAPRTPTFTLAKELSNV